MSFLVELVSGRFRDRVRHRLHQGRKICSKSISKAKEVIASAKSTAISPSTKEAFKKGMRNLSKLLLILAGIFALYYLYWMFMAAKKRFIQVGVVSSITCYPVTSCQGVSFGTAECTNNGIAVHSIMDREFFIGIRADRKKIHMFQSPQIKHVKVLPDQRNLVLSTPKNKQLKLSMEEIKKATNSGDTLYWKDLQMPVTDCGDKASNYLTTAFKSDKKLSLYNFGKMFSTSGKKMSYVIIPSSSIEMANVMLHLNPPLSIDYFRPNILVSKTEPFDEENWETLRIGEEVTFKIEKSALTLLEENYNTDEHEWKHEVEPYSSIPKAVFMPASCRMVSVGVLGTLLHGGEIHVGDDVFVTYKSTPIAC